MIGRPRFHKKETSKRRLAAVFLAWLVSAAGAYYLGSEWRACVRPAYLVSVDLALQSVALALNLSSQSPIYDHSLRRNAIGARVPQSLIELSSTVLATSKLVDASPLAPTVAPWPYETCSDYYHALPYKWASHIPVSEELAKARAAQRQPTAEELKDTAIVTMATGDAAARGATALMQSLIDSGTRVPTLLVLIFRGGHGSKWCDDYPRKQARHGTMNVYCGYECALCHAIF
jgi:hypothetical protein